jgi:hypothetical protein
MPRPDKKRATPEDAAPVLPRRTLRIVVVLAGVALVIIGAWAGWARLHGPLPAASDRPELLALRGKLVAVQDALTPIAVSFTARTATHTLDVTEYERRIADARRVVESVNNVDLTSTRALDIRDNILTGGSDVLTGFQQALDALRSDDTSASDAAGQLVDQGVAELDSAKQDLDRLLGPTGSTQ